MLFRSMLSIFVSLAVCEYYVQEGVLYVKDEPTVSQAEIAELKDLFNKAVVDDKAFVIGKSAFEDCEKLTEVELSDSIECIKQRAFYNCRNLQKIKFGSGLNLIEADAFYGSEVNELNLSDSIKVIESGCFSEFSVLQSIIIPNSVDSLGSKVFMNCKNLESVTFGSGMTKVEEYSFMGCTKLKTIVFGKSISSIFDYAFSNTSISDVFEFPNNVINIGNHSFENTNISALVLHQDIQQIGEYAFSSKSLSCVFYKGKTLPPKVSQNAFEGTKVIKVMTYLNYTDNNFGKFKVFAGDDLQTCFEFKGENAKKRLIIISVVSFFFVVLIFVMIIYRKKTINKDQGVSDHYEEILKYSEIQ